MGINNISSARLTIVALVFLLFALGSFVCLQAAAQTATKVDLLRVSHQPVYEGFLTWQAIQEGLDKKAGLELKMVYFDSGMPQVEALTAKQWDIGSIGTVPMLLAALRLDALMVATSYDDSYNHFVLVRPDSPILKTKGANPKYPEVYGKAEDIKGKTILVTTVSAGHYVVSSWLKVFGLKDSDVKIQNMEAGQVLAAFESGKGDICELWSPFAPLAVLKKGWKKVCIGNDVGARMFMPVILDKDVAARRPDAVVKFLRLWFQQIDRQKKEGLTSATLALYQKYMKDWAGMSLTEEMARWDNELEPLWGLKQQQELFDSSKGPCQIEKWFAGVADFFADNGRIKPEERDQAMKKKFVTDKFLKLLAKGQ